MGRKEQERRKLKRAAWIIIMKMGKQGLAMIHTHYDKVINMEESFNNVFAQLDTRKLEYETLLWYGVYSAQKLLRLCSSTIYLWQIDDNWVVGKVSIVRVSARWRWTQ